MLNWLQQRRSRRTTRRLVARSNEEWLAELRGEDPGPALEDLRVVLQQGLLPVLRRRTPRQAEAFVEDTVQDALLHLMERLDTFRGEARFTTWATKVAVRLALSELRRLRWKDVSLEGLLETSGDGPMADPEPSPEDYAMMERRAEWVERLMKEALTERQRTAIQAIMIGGMPMDEVARRMDTNRNALYKLLFDARQRLRQAFEAEGLSLDDFLTEDV